MNTPPPTAQKRDPEQLPARLGGLLSIALTPWLLALTYQHWVAGIYWLSATAFVTAAAVLFARRRSRPANGPRPEILASAGLLVVTALANNWVSGSFADPSFAGLLIATGVISLLVSPAAGAITLGLTCALGGVFWLAPTLGIAVPSGLPPELTRLHNFIERAGPLLAAPIILYGVVLVRRRPESSLEQAREELRNASQKAVEIQRRYSEIESTAVSGLALGVGHQINNRLTALIGDLQFLESQLQDATDPAVGRFAEDATPIIRETLDIAWAAAHDVRHLSLLHSDGRSEELEIGPLLEQSVQLLPSTIRRRASFHVDIAPDLVTVGDSSLVITSLTELLRNAALALAERPGQDSTISVQALRKSSRILIEIADTGCGMTEDVLERCREPFFTTRPIESGTGMGLTKASDTFERMGGTLELESAPGAGTRVLIDLPCAEDADSPPLDE